jgi:ArsR family transcriptional regulator
MSQVKVKSKAKIITKEELLEKIKKNESVQIVNVLDPEYYSLGLIKGSKKIPLDELDKRLKDLDKTKEVVTYCSGYQCSASGMAAEYLSGKGFSARAYTGGIKEWTEAGLPRE